MQLHLTTDYAVRCILCLSGKKGSIPAKDICEFAAIGKPYGYRVLHLLKEAGIVEMKMGANGGFTLLKDPKDITRLEIMHATEDTVKINRCLEDDGYCSNSGVEKCCAVHRFYQGMQNYFEERLKNITIKDMADSKDISEIVNRVKKK